MFTFEHISYLRFKRELGFLGHILDNVHPSKESWIWPGHEQDPASTMQKTGWTIHSIFLVLSGPKKSFTLDVITWGQSTTIFLCIRPFSAWWRTNDNQVILEQACSWPVWEGSLLQLYYEPSCEHCWQGRICNEYSPNCVSRVSWYSSRKLLETIILTEFCPFIGHRWLAPILQFSVAFGVMHQFTLNQLCKFQITFSLPFLIFLPHRSHTLVLI